jgi:hypothetical protein
MRQVSISITRQILQKFIPKTSRRDSWIIRRPARPRPTKLLDDITFDYSSSMKKWLKFLENLEYILWDYIPTGSLEAEIDARDY